MNEKKRQKERERGCWQAAMRRARQARRRGMNPFLIVLLFILALGTGPFTEPRFVTSPLRRPDRDRQSGGTDADDWPVTDYERGVSGPCVPAHRPGRAAIGRDLRSPG